MTFPKAIVRGLAFLVAISVLFACVATTHADGVEVKKKGPPDRNKGDESSMGDNTRCPPGPYKDLPGKGVPYAHRGDKDVNDDGRLDFNMGEYHYILGDKDIKIRIWCINKTDAGYSDYFSSEILTSDDGVDNKPAAVPPGYPD